MAITIESENKKIISLEEYLAFAATVDPYDIEAVIASADKLKQLANNRGFLSEKFNEELSVLSSFEYASASPSQTLELGRGKSFYVRANMWVPRSGNAENQDWENHLFSYSYPHDHNFLLLTAGYYGPGYATSIYEYDADSVIGYEGEKVDISFLEHTTLPEGKLMLYRASKDLHSQEEPVDFSISLNLLLFTPEMSLRNQYWFDINKSKIRSFIQNSGAARMLICRFAKYIHNDTTIDLLERISSEHIIPKVRVSAYEALANIKSEDKDKVWHLALTDKHEYVRLKAADNLDNSKFNY